MGDLSELTDEQVDAELAELEALLDEEEMGKGVAGAPAKTEEQIKLDKQLKKLRQKQDEVTAVLQSSGPQYTEAEEKELERELADLLK